MSSIAVKLKADLCRPKPGGQSRFLPDWEHYFVGLQGGWAGGKTWAGARKLLVAHVVNAFDENRQPTFCPQGCVGPTYKGLRDYCVPALRQAAADFGLSCHFKRGDSILTFPDLGMRDNPSFIYCRSADNPEAIAGWEVGYGWGDEPTRWPEDWQDPKLDSFLQFVGRVGRHPKAKMRGMCLTYTNEGDGTRMYGFFREADKTRALYTARTADNDAVHEFYEQQKKTLTKEMQDQYLEGGAMSLRGKKCYSSYEAAEHCKDVAKFIPGVPISICVDFNINPGMHALAGQYIEPLDAFSVFAEFFAPRLTIDGLAPLIAQRVLSHGQRTVKLYGDPSGNVETMKSGDSYWDWMIEALRVQGIAVELYAKKKAPAQIDRVNAVQVALKDPSGIRHVVIHPDCEKLLTDLRFVKWDNHGKIEKTNPDLTHASDALGYWIEYVRPVRVKTQPKPERFSVNIRTTPGVVSSR